MNDTALLVAELTACAAIVESALSGPITAEDTVLALHVGARYHALADEVLARTGLDPRPDL